MGGAFRFFFGFQRFITVCKSIVSRGIHYRSCGFQVVIEKNNERLSLKPSEEYNFGKN